MKLIKAENLQNALDLNQEITGSYFYSMYENVRKDHERLNKDVINYFVDTATGSIYYLTRTEVGQYTQGETILHKLTISSCLSSHGFNQFIISDINDDGTIEARIESQGWDRSKKNRKAIAKMGYMITTEAATA